MTILLSLLIIIAAVVVIVPVMTGYQQLGLQLLVSNPLMSGNEAFGKVLKFGKGYGKKYFALCWSYIGGMLLSIITFGLYLIRLVPEMQMAFTILNDEIVSQQMRAQTEGVRCNQCGTVNAPGSAFCVNCGNKLN